MKHFHKKYNVPSIPVYKKFEYKTAKYSINSKINEIISIQCLQNVKKLLK